MTREGWVSLLLSIPVGIISGLYAGLIVARYQRFSDLRSQVLRIIREIDYSHDGVQMLFPKRKEVPEFTLIASDFYFLKHQRAGKETSRLQSEISESLYLGSKGKIGYELFEEKYITWQHRGRQLHPNLLWILRLGGGL